MPAFKLQIACVRSSMTKCWTTYNVDELPLKVATAVFSSKVMLC